MVKLQPKNPRIIFVSRYNPGVVKIYKLDKYGRIPKDVIQSENPFKKETAETDIKLPPKMQHKSPPMPSPIMQMPPMQMQSPPLLNPMNTCFMNAIQFGPLSPDLIISDKDDIKVPQQPRIIQAIPSIVTPLTL